MPGQQRACAGGGRRAVLLAGRKQTAPHRGGDAVREMLNVLDRDRSNDRPPRL
jgi:hypothetical protein